jgi:hypothetical protein
MNFTHHCKNFITFLEIIILFFVLGLGERFFAQNPVSNNFCFTSKEGIELNLFFTNQSISQKKREKGYDVTLESYKNCVD